MSPRAMGRVRGLAVGAGVPLAFALLAVLLAFGGAGAPAGAAEPRAARVRAEASTAVWSVRRTLIRDFASPMRVSSREHTSDPVVFITIDDGGHKDRRALRYVEAHQIPITAFLSTWTIKESAPYFTRLTRWGSIQNHSATHASLADSATDLDHEICQSQRTFAKDFGASPWLLRPPYGVGAGRLEVQVAAARCGITGMVLWDAVVGKGRLSVPGGVLRAGDIVLLHFTPGLTHQVVALLGLIARQHLRPAPLESYV